MVEQCRSRGSAQLARAKIPLTLLEHGSPESPEVRQEGRAHLLLRQQRAVPPVRLKSALATGNSGSEQRGGQAADQAMQPSERSSRTAIWQVAVCGGDQSLWRPLPTHRLHSKSSSTKLAAGTGQHCPQQQQAPEETLIVPPHLEVAHIQRLQLRPAGGRVEAGEHVRGVLSRVRVDHTSARVALSPAADIVDLCSRPTSAIFVLDQPGDAASGSAGRSIPWVQVGCVLTNAAIAREAARIIVRSDVRGRRLTIACATRSWSLSGRRSHLSVDDEPRVILRAVLCDLCRGVDVRTNVQNAGGAAGHLQL